MNILTTNPDAGRLVAQQLINERVRAAEQARDARALRRERRTARMLGQHPATRPGVRWAIRFPSLTH